MSGDGRGQVVVSGARGRLGARVAALVEAHPRLHLAASLVRSVDAAVVRAVTVAEDAIVPGRILVEAAPKGPALHHLELAAARGVPVVLATTGFSEAELARIEAAAERVPIVLAPNLSLGIAVLSELVAIASAALPDYDLELVEMHHNGKRDAPSGTAWALARRAAAARGQDADRSAILARAGDVGPRAKGEIGIQSLRGGGVVGDHTVYFVGAAERLELTHRAHDRDVFAEGAARAAEFLAAGRPAGRYTMRDVLGLSGLALQR